MLEHRFEYPVEPQLPFADGGMKQPGIAEYGAPEHHAVGPGLRREQAPVGRVAHIAVADDRHVAAACLADRARDGIPVRGGVGQLAYGAGVQGDRRRAQLQQRREPLLERVALDADARLDRYRQTAGAFARGGVDLAHAHRVADQGGAGALPEHAPVRAAGVDVDAVETELPRELGTAEERLRARSEELHDQRPFALMVGEFRQQPVPATRAESLAGGKFGHHHVRSPAARNDLPERGVGDVGHRRQQHHGARQDSPEAGRRRRRRGGGGIDLHCASAYVCCRPRVQGRQTRYRR